MRRFPALVLPLAFAAQALQAQATPTLPIPEVKPYIHAGTIETSYEEEEQSTSVFLTMPMSEAELEAFAGNSRITRAHLDAGFVHPGSVMSSYPGVVTLVLKLVHAQPPKQPSGPAPLDYIVFAVDGRQAVKVTAPLVNRSAVDGSRKQRSVEDTYVAVLRLDEFLALVNGGTVTATLEQYELTFTGPPLEGLRDLASRITVVR